MKLPESENYVTNIGFSEEFKRDCYLVTNKNTGVVEMETTIFSYARDAVEQLENLLNGEVKLGKDKILQ